MVEAVPRRGPIGHLCFRGAPGRNPLNLRFASAASPPETFIVFYMDLCKGVYYMVLLICLMGNVVCFGRGGGIRGHGITQETTEEARSPGIALNSAVNDFGVARMPAAEGTGPYSEFVIQRSLLHAKFMYEIMGSRHNHSSFGVALLPCIRSSIKFEYRPPQDLDAPRRQQALRTAAAPAQGGGHYIWAEASRIRSRDAGATRGENAPQPTARSSGGGRMASSVSQSFPGSCVEVHRWALEGRLERPA